jgi:hypothetical protein
MRIAKTRRCQIRGLGRRVLNVPHADVGLDLALRSRFAVPVLRNARYHVEGFSVEILVPYARIGCVYVLIIMRTLCAEPVRTEN